MALDLRVIYFNVLDMEDCHLDNRTDWFAVI